MSAYIVGHDHIDYLVSAFGAHGAAAHMDIRVEVPQGTDGLNPEALQPGWDDTLLWSPVYDTDQLGRMLWQLNYDSVAYRYPHADSLPGPIPTPEPSTYRHKPVPWDLITPAQTINAIHCWQYQTCEDPTAEQHVAWAASQALYETAVRLLVRENEPVAWEWSRPAHASS